MHGSTGAEIQRETLIKLVSMVKAEQTLIGWGDLDAAMGLRDIQDDGRQACRGKARGKAMAKGAQRGIGRAVGKDSGSGDTRHAAVNHQTGRAALTRPSFPTAECSYRDCS